LTGSCELIARPMMLAPALVIGAKSFTGSNGMFL